MGDQSAVDNPVLNWLCCYNQCNQAPTELQTGPAMSIKTTAYDMVAGRLREEILSRRLRPGQQLPPERKLCARFAASRITIRRALQILEQEVLIQRRQGSGTFVSPCPSRKIPLCSMDFSGSVARHAPDLRRRLHDWERSGATPETAAQLGLLPGDELTHARRVDYLKGKPVAMDELYLVGSLSDRLTGQDLARLEFIEHWVRIQRLQFDYTTQVIEALAAEPPVARILEIPRKAPLLKETNVFYLVGGRRAGLFLSWYRHEHFRFEATFPLSTHRNGRAT